MGGTTPHQSATDRRNLMKEEQLPPPLPKRRESNNLQMTIA